MGRLRAASLLLAALAAGLLLSACGGSSAKLLPGPTADKIISNLDQVRENVDEKNCETAEVGVATVSTEVDELEKVDAQLKKALEHGALKLSEVVSSCGVAVEEAAEEKAAEETEEREKVESEEAEEEALELEHEEELEEKAEEKAEKEAEEAEPPTGGEESVPPGKAKGHETQEEIEPPNPEETEVTPPAEGEGPAGGIGPGASVEGGP
jgi:hypothetical protein